MARTKISEFSSTPANNTDIDSINIAEGCAPSGINDAIRELMSQLKDWQSGTSNDPMVIGSSGSLTLNQGTANGVAYLNGSKVVTSGSALTFDGTNLGIGAATALKPLDISFAGTSGARRFLVSYDDSVITIKGANASNDPEAIRITGDNIRFNTGTSGSGSEVGRFTSTGLGIGTSSPAAKLDVSGAASTNSESRFVAKLADTSSVAQGNGGGLVFRGVYTGSTLVDASGIQAYKENATDGNYAYGLAFVTRANGGNLTANMRLDGSGNLGLGVTPSAWSNMVPALELGSFGSAIAAWTNNRNMYLLSNAFYNGSDFIYKTTGGAVYQQISGESREFRWFTAPSGTAGNAITFTQAMTLDASGNLIVGGTSALGNTTNRGNITLNGTSSALYSLGVGGLLKGYLFHGGTDMELQNSANGYLSFATNGSECARIDSSGKILLGTTTAFSNAFTSVYYVPGTTYGIGFKPSTDSNTPKPCSFLNSSATEVGSITTTASATAYNTTSDQRLKENIQDSDSASSLIDSLKVRKFDWKSDNTHQRYGFVAQELVTVAPETVHQPEDPDQMMAVDYSKLVPMLVKEIQSLRKRLADANL